MIKLIENVTHDGARYKIGDVIEKINKKDAQRLVNLKVAYFVSGNIEENNQKEEKEPETTNDEKESGTDGENHKVAAEELDTIGYQDLKEIAKELNLEFAGNISKVKLIELIISEDKYEEVLAFTEVED